MIPIGGWLIGHLVGDFLLQNDALALGKKRSHLLCFIHVTIYTMAVCLFAGWFRPWVIALVFVPHYLIDRYNFVPWYMFAMGQRVFLDPPMSPWSRIVVDNTMHLVCLYATAYLVVRYG